MPIVYIPPALRPLTGGQERVAVSAGSVREAIAELESQFPGVEARLVVDGDIRPGMAIAVDGNISSLGMLQKLTPDCEVHFLPAVGGG